MSFSSHSIRPFIGAKDFRIAQAFYHALGFEEISIDNKMSYFKIDEKVGFYLQNYYAKDWVDNTMLFWEVTDLDQCHLEISAKKLPAKFKGVRLSAIKTEDWGREFFLHDPSGILWHIGTFA